MGYVVESKAEFSQIVTAILANDNSKNNITIGNYTISITNEFDEEDQLRLAFQVFKFVLKPGNSFFIHGINRIKQFYPELYDISSLTSCSGAYVWTHTELLNLYDYLIRASKLIAFK